MHSFLKFSENVLYSASQVQGYYVLARVMGFCMCGETAERPFELTQQIINGIPLKRIKRLERGLILNASNFCIGKILECRPAHFEKKCQPARIGDKYFLKLT